ncbi:uncharacterized protein LOC133887926 isoform X2 [Phragmites australis]|uniref:uncharacterized protein LOC133887926 isoform X2 n=1 Tax=Phragmites australis TaxID=29695 RepID=UPI002D7717B8|nr:uncharacterized protein LOC133887926 isoform X2 [Phragmites australis]
MEAHPVSASQGLVRSLPAKIERLLSEPEQELREGEKHKILLLKDHLQHLIDGYLLEPSEVEFPASTAKCWAEEVRELSYDIDDFLDELVHANAAHKKLRGKIARLLQGRSRSRWVANEVSRFRARLEEAIQRYNRYFPDRCMKRSPSSIDSDACRLPPLYGVEAAGLVGIESSLGKLEEWLTDQGERRLRVASIVGFAGVGKTTLAKQLYCRLGWRFDCRAFVRSSQKPDLKKLLTSILLQVRQHRPPDALESCNLASTIKAHLRNKKYFIIIDDIWASSTWGIVHQALPDDNCFSRILTTTEVDVVAHTCCGHNSKHIFKMEPLSKEKSNDLFFSRFVGKQYEFPSFKTKISSEIISKSGGFPLVTIATASLLATQPDTIEQWNYIWSSLSSNLKTNATIEGMKQVLSLCYSNLPDHLKTCMLYLSLYQENHIICKNDLVKQWITEGFICAKEGKDTEEVASTCFDELVTRGMIQPVDINHNGEVLSCTVHYMIHQLIQYKSIEENFVTAIDHSETNIRVADKVRRLSLHFGDAEDVKPPEKLRLSQIRSLFFFGPFKSLPSIVEFRLLRVLILHLWGDQDYIRFDLTTVSKLFRLRYFAIACNVTLNLQSQLQGLQYLETLKIDSRLSEVPQDIVHLPSLLHLSLPGDTILPNGIGHMASLHTLGCFDLSSNSAGNVLSLRELTNLRDLRLTCSRVLCENLEENLGFLASVLSKLSNLKSLTLLPAACSSNASTSEASDSRNNISFDGLSRVSSPPATLEKLELSPRIVIFSRLPRWIGELGKLSILKIAAREVWQSDIDILKNLNSLAALSLYVRTTPAERIIFDKEGFLVLKHFKFICSALSLAFEKRALPNVRRLKLGFNANRLEQYSLADAGFENLTGLAVFSAKIGCAGAAESCREAVNSVLDDAFSKCVRRPVINVQWVDWIFYGDTEMTVPQKEQPQTLGKADLVKKVGSDDEIGGKNSTEDTNRRDDSRITLPLDSPSHMQHPGSKTAIVMKNEMVSISNSLLIKLETLMGERNAELTGMGQQGFILKDELQSINDLLKHLSDMADLNIQMKECRNLMRELAYDIEDFIDYLMVHGVNEKGTPDKLVMLQDFIDQIQKLKAQLEEADLGSMVRKTGMRTSGPSYMASKQWLPKIYNDGTCLVGMDGPRDELVRQLIGGDQDQLQGLCILGAAGIGKTTLATQVCNDIKRRFDCCAFVSASKVDISDKVRMARLFRSLLSQLPGTINIKYTSMGSLIYGIKRNLQDKRFLIVIDGVWSAQILEHIKVALPENKRGSRIITTTHSSDVAKLCGEYFYSFIYQMKPLTFEESRRLFHGIIFGSGGSSCPVARGKVAEEIVKACGGIPLAIRVIAGALASKLPEIEQWVTYVEIVKQAGTDHLNVEWMRKIFDISYSDISCDMKTCLLYLGALPENHVIRKDRLIRKWAAEGFLPKISEETWWETGERYFLELVARKLIEPVYDEEDLLPIGCKVSGSIHDFITSLSSEENFAKSDVTDPTCLQHGVFRRLYVDLGFGNQEKPVALFQGAISSKVRSLTFVGDFGGMPDLSAFKHVRVLDLEDTKGLENKQLESIGRLSLLRYLGLVGTGVTELPQQIAALEQLTTLDLRRTRVRKLPAFGDMKLVSLLADELITTLGMGEMQKLEELSKVLLGDDGSFAKDVVGLVNKLRQLRMLGVRFGHLYAGNDTDRPGVKYFLEEVGKSNLQSLFLDKYPHSLLHLLFDCWAQKRPHYLRKFELRIPGCLPLVPQEIASLIALTHLHVNVEVVEAEGVRALGKLPNLVLLKLCSDSGPRLTVSSMDGFQFQCLKVFSYISHRGGMGLQFEAGAMPQLQRLWLDFNVQETLSKYGDFDFRIQHLSCLQQVHATIDYGGTSTALEVEAAEAYIRDQVSQNPNNPVLELNTRHHGHLTPHQGQRSTAKAVEESVIAIHSLDEWSIQLDEANSADPKKLVVIHFTASWCEPSRRMAPVFADLANQFPNVVFLKVAVDDDDDEMSNIAELLGAEKLPTFVFMKGGDIKDSVVGATEEELLEKFTQHKLLMTSTEKFTQHKLLMTSTDSKMIQNPAKDLLIDTYGQLSFLE